MWFCALPNSLHPTTSQSLTSMTWSFLSAFPCLALILRIQMQFCVGSGAASVASPYSGALWISSMLALRPRSSWLPPQNVEKFFLAACDCRPQYTLAGGVLVVHVVLHQIASYYIMLLQSMARVLKLAGVACSTHRSRGGAPASGHVWDGPHGKPWGKTREVRARAVPHF